MAVENAKQPVVRRPRQRCGEFVRVHRELFRRLRCNVAHGDEIDRTGEPGGPVGYADDKAASFMRIRAAAAVDETAP
jgi:hypothetical protein